MHLALADEIRLVTGHAINSCHLLFRNIKKISASVKIALTILGPFG